MYTSSGEVLFFAGTLVVRYKKARVDGTGEDVWKVLQTCFVRVRMISIVRCAAILGEIYTKSVFELTFPSSVLWPNGAKSCSASSPSVDLSRMDVPKKIQRFFTDHTDEVLCLDTHPSSGLVASGQRGRLPKVPKI